MGTLASPTILSVSNGSNQKIVTLSVAGSSSYATGGDTFDLSVATLGLAGGFTVVNNVVGSADGGQYGVMHDRASAGAPATSKILFYNAGAADGGDEVANATDLSAQTFYLTIFGR